MNKNNALIKTITDYSTFLTYSKTIQNRRSLKMAEKIDVGMGDANNINDDVNTKNAMEVETETFECERCGESFTLSTEDLVLRNGDTRFCSEECELLAASDNEELDPDDDDNDDNDTDDDDDNDDDEFDDEDDDEGYSDDDYDDEADDDEDNKDDEND
jgi:hypothetical protein